MEQTNFVPRVTCLCGSDVETQDAGGGRFEGHCASCGRDLAYDVKSDERLKELEASEAAAKSEKAGRN